MISSKEGTGGNSRSVVLLLRKVEVAVIALWQKCPMMAALNKLSIGRADTLLVVTFDQKSYFSVWESSLSALFKGGYDLSCQNKRLSSWTDSMTAQGNDLKKKKSYCTWSRYTHLNCGFITTFVHSHTQHKSFFFSCLLKVTCHHARTRNFGKTDHGGVSTYLIPDLVTLVKHEEVGCAFVHNLHSGAIYNHVLKWPLTLTVFFFLEFFYCTFLSSMSMITAIT